MSVVFFPGRPWTRKDLLTVYDLAEKGESLRHIAPCVGRTPLECDLLLWAVLCTETVTQALELVNGEGDGGSRQPPVTASV